jgi:hypothetical protein
VSEILNGLHSERQPERVSDESLSLFSSIIDSIIVREILDEAAWLKASIERGETWMDRAIARI